MQMASSAVVSHVLSKVAPPVFGRAELECFVVTKMTSKAVIMAVVQYQVN